MILSSAIIEAGDYMEIELPEDYDIEFITGSASCSADGFEVSACTIPSNKKARVVFGASSPLTFVSGEISNFANPESNRRQQNIQIVINDSSGDSKTSIYIGSLSNFESSSVTATLSSSSNIISKSS